MSLQGLNNFLKAQPSLNRLSSEKAFQAGITDTDCLSSRPRSLCLNPSNPNHCVSLAQHPAQAHPHLRKTAPRVRNWYGIGNWLLEVSDSFEPQGFCPPSVAFPNRKSFSLITS